MALSPGTRIGPYEIGSPLGAGGMGEVYRARDTKLDRDVAIKVLPESFVADAERVARFQREAKTLAALNHPNIGGIHGLAEDGGISALVLELVEGPTLADRIAQGALPVDEALPIAKQIAEALEAAHEQGIIHRDLKPANIKVRPDGTVKVLDFGLAKAMEPVSALSPARSLATITSPAMTQVGMVLGTAAYMAPEQARGRPIDRRVDIWAFGCVLFEMLTGRPAFDGDDVAETLGAIIHKEPPWSALPAAAPTSVMALIRRCLDKDPKQRLRDIGDARLEIENALRAPASPGSVAPALVRRQWVGRAGWAVAVVFGIVAATVSLVHLTERAPAAPPELRFDIAAPENVTVLQSGTVSPDGRLIAFPARDERGAISIWVRSLDSTQARVLPAATLSVARSLFWSPDSRFIAYAAPDGQLKRIAVSGGPPQSIASLDGTAPQFRGGAWSPRGIIIFGMFGKGLRQVAADGGPATTVTQFDPEREIAHAEPTFLPDGTRFLYTRIGFKAEDSGVDRGALDTPSSPGGQNRLLETATGVQFVAGQSQTAGHLLFLRGGTLMAQPFDAARVQPVGEAVPVADGLPDSVMRPFSVSANGVLALRKGGSRAGSSLRWFDRQGKPLGDVGPPGWYGDVKVSHDGTIAIVSRREVEAGPDSINHLWMLDLRRNTPRRVNPGEPLDYAPALSPDGRIAFSYGGARDIYVRSLSSAEPPQLLLKTSNGKQPNDWSADGRFLIYDENISTGSQDLWVLPLAVGRKPIPFATTAARESLGQFSPDDQWVAYCSDESGRREIYVVKFAPDRVPAVGSAPIPISSAGGDKPRWRPDGKELYYVAPNGNLMAVPVTLTPTFKPGVAVPLFDMRLVGTLGYDVTADGRFLVNTSVETTGAAAPPITVVLNWQGGLAARATDK